MSKNKINYDKEDDKDLKDFLEEHFCYEVEKLIACNNKIIANQDKDIFLECLCLHARNIIEFLFFKEKPNYNRAKYYIDIEKWETWKQNYEKYEATFGKINYSVAHLTFNRKKPVKTGGEKDLKWTNESFFMLLLKDVAKFLDMLPEKFVSQKIEQIKQSLQRTFKS